MVQRQPPAPFYARPGMTAGRFANWLLGQ